MPSTLTVLKVRLCCLCVQYLSFRTASYRLAVHKNTTGFTYADLLLNGNDWHHPNDKGSV